MRSTPPPAAPRRSDSRAGGWSPGAPCSVRARGSTKGSWRLSVVEQGAAEDRRAEGARASVAQTGQHGALACVVALVAARAREPALEPQAAVLVVDQRRPGGDGAEETGFAAALIRADLEAGDGARLSPELGPLPVRRRAVRHAEHDFRVQPVRGAREDPLEFAQRGHGARAM